MLGVVLWNVQQYVKSIYVYIRIILHVKNITRYFVSYVILRKYNTVLRSVHVLYNIRMYYDIRIISYLGTTVKAFRLDLSVSSRRGSGGGRGGGGGAVVYYC